MKRAVTLALTLSVIFPVVVGQETKTTDVSIQGHVYEPAKLEPSDERVARLRLPAGFRVQKFAELQNPRMLAVGADGTVYVSQREPGTVAMLKDTDGDGVADVQRVVAEKEMIHGLSVHEGKLYLAAVKEVFVANIPASVTSLSASLPKTESMAQLRGAAQGANHTGMLGYYGPHPPSGEPPHRYHFQVFALDTVLRLPAGFNRHALMRSHARPHAGEGRAGRHLPTQTLVIRGTASAAGRSYS